ncbi:hypothetical protein ACIQM4_10545 [Streptomyces sp. NPDC091272]|uniref:hypothetical protein n=1 Tax=Streptomyces sp. NPDC091272 TaxID=3365981 RepID=UPI0037F9F622
MSAFTVLTSAVSGYLGLDPEKTNSWGFFSAHVAAIQLSGFVIYYIFLHFAVSNMRWQFKADVELTVHAHLLYVLYACAHPNPIKFDSVHIDREVNLLCLALRSVAAHGRPGVPPVRRDQSAMHLRQVAATIEDSAEGILVKGVDGREALMELAIKVFERSARGCWHGLLDDSDLSPRAQVLATENSLGSDDRREFRMAIAGAFLALIFAACSAFLNVPSVVSLAIAAIIATLPAALHRGRRGRLSSADFLSQTRQAFVAVPEEGSVRGPTTGPGPDRP